MLKKIIYKSALRITLIYFIISAAWIFFSDQFLDSLFTDVNKISYYQTVKGWIFVLVTSLIIYFLIKQHLIKIKTANDKAKNHLVSWKFALEGSGDGIWDWNIKNNSIFFSDVWKEMLGYKVHEIKNIMEDWKKLVHPNDLNKLEHKLDLLYKNEIDSFLLEYRMRCKSGKYKWILDRCKVITKDENDEPIRIIGIHEDIDDRKQKEFDLVKSNRSLILLSICNHALIYNKDEKNLLDEICQIIVNAGEYKFAWIGYAREDEFKSIRPVAQAGYETGYLENIKISFDDNEFGQGPSGVAIRTKEISIINDSQHDVRFTPWKEEAAKRNYNSSISLPLLFEDDVLGVLNIYSVEINAFNHNEIRLLTNLANDLSFGIGTIRIRNKQKEYEEALQLTKERYRLAVSAAKAGVWDLEITKNKIYIDTNLKNLLGYNDNEIIDDTEHWYKLIHPEDRNLLKNKIYNFSEYNISNFEIELRMLCKNDITKWFFVRGNIIRDAEGKAERVIATNVDISNLKLIDFELRKSEEKLRLAVENYPDSFIIYNSKRQIEYVNYNSERIAGKSREYIIGKIDEEIFPPEVVNQYLSILIETIKTKKRTSKEISIKTYDGKNLDLIMTYVPLLNENGEIHQVVGTSQNITEIKKVQFELMESKEKYRKLAAKQQLIREDERLRISREIHDELGQALTALKLDTMILKKKLNKDDNDSISKSDKMIKDIDSTINQVRKISYQLRPSVLDDFGIIAAIESEIEEFGTRTNIKCNLISDLEELKLHKNISIGIFRIFQECLTNIARHSQADLVEVEISMLKNNLQLSISDNGIGLDQNQIESDKSIGLLGMKERAILIGGKLSFSNSKNGGTKVTLIISNIN